MEWISTVRYIEQTKRPFHFLLPSLRANQISNDHYCVNLLASLIQVEAIGGSAHVVALCMGAHIAILLATRWPNLVKSLNISGINGFSILTKPLLPVGLFLFFPFSFAECRGLSKILLSSRNVQSLPVRTLINVGLSPCRIAGINTHDDPKAAKDFAKQIRDQKVVVKAGEWMKHRWNVRDPNVYAAEIVSWIDDKPFSELLGRQFVDLII